MSNKYVFDDVSSVIHVLLGIAINALKHISPLVSVTAIVLFTIYEVREREKGIKTMGDFIELIIGVLIGLYLVP